jgi:YegS/Rv2252/BmrU family lipid kinase
MDRSYFFILNPISGAHRDPKKIRFFIEKYFESVSFRIVETKHAGHAHELAKEAAGEFDVVVAIGGDGTVNEVGSALIKTDAILGIIPAGSGNGVARNLEIPLDQEEAVKFLFYAEEKKIDTGELNDKKFIGAAGVGFDGFIGFQFNSLEKRGALPYFKLTLQHFFSYSPKKYRIFLSENREISGNYLVVAVSNSKQYGNDALITPHAILDDGEFALTLVKPFRFWNILPLVYRLFSGTIKKSKFIETYKSSFVKIESDEDIFAHTDGEPLKLRKNVDFQMNEKSLRVFYNG